MRQPVTPDALCSFRQGRLMIFVASLETMLAKVRAGIALAEAVHLAEDVAIVHSV